jgi:hypothetical protein
VQGPAELPNGHGQADRGNAWEPHQKVICSRHRLEAPMDALSRAGRREIAF